MERPSGVTFKHRMLGGAGVIFLFLVSTCCSPSVLAAPQPPSPKPHTPASASAPAPAANLVANGDFEKADATGRLPAGWTTKHPDNVKRIRLDGPRGWVIEMTGDKELMGTYGTDLLSAKIPVKANTRYRCTGYTKSAGPRMIVFVKGYAMLTHSVKGQQQTTEEAIYQMRKEIKPSPDWEPFNLDFDIQPTLEFSQFQHPVEYLRITLWAYWPEGTCWYDDIRFEEVGPVPDDQRRGDLAITHAGTKPRLAETQPADSQPAFDEEQTWIDAQNAWQEENYKSALDLAEQLIARTPSRGDYRVLAARAAARLQRWPQADQHAQWLLAESADAGSPAVAAAASQPARKVEPWQLDWARLVHAEALLHANQPDQARRLLLQVRDTASSASARAAAEELLNRN